MMHNASGFGCEQCRAALPEYVRRELANEPLEGIYAAVTDHLQSCAACEALYYREFRRQGLAKPLAELQQVGRRAAVAAVMEQILAPTVPETAPRDEWRQVIFDYGQGWIERAGEAWRQVEVFLGNLGRPGEFAPALAGLMSAGADREPASAGLAVAPEGANFELHIGVVAHPEDDQLCDLEVTLTLYDRFGDYSGVEVTLLHERAVQQAVTDSLGKVRFAALNCDELKTARLVVHLPE